MEQHNRAPHEHGHDDPSPRSADAAAPQQPRDAEAAAAPQQQPGADARSGLPARRPARGGASAVLRGAEGTADPGPVRTVRIVAGDHLLTVNPVDGSEVEPCPPAERSARPARPERHTPDQRAELRRAAAPPRPSGTVVPDLPMLERDEERERLARLLARGRSVRVTGPSGAGRSVLLEAVAADCERLAPDGVVRLSGYRRTPTDLLYDLYAAVYRAPLHRPERAELLEAVQEIGAVVVLDDIEFGGAALDEFLDATPECAFLISATPDVPAPSADSHLEEVSLPGLSRTAGLELLERALRRPLEEDEASWAADLWFESEGLPLRFVQAGALLRQREAAVADTAGGAAAAEADAEPQDAAPLPSIPEAAAPAALLAAGLGEAARDALRFAVALGGECPHQAHLPALTDDPHADAALGELLAHGLATTVGPHYRLAAGVAAQLAAEGYAGDAAESAGRAHTVAHHYTWWAGHPSVAPERVAVEADAILAAMAALVSDREAGHADAAVELARAAAPAFAAALHWGAWERAVRHGQEAARLAGQVADEAYFHHELGVLALCTGNLDRARAELEASIGLRGALADKRGMVAGRRALALVSDRTGAAMAGAFGPGVAWTRPEALESAAAPEPAAEPEPAPAPGENATTVVTPVVAETTKIPPVAAATTTLAAPPAKKKGLRALALTGARRNLVAAGAGALLVAVLGTVAALGAFGGDDDKDAPDRVKPRESASRQDDDKDLTADEPSNAHSQGAPQPGPSNVPLSSPSSVPTSSGTPSGTSGPTDPSTSGEPTQPQSPSAPTSPPRTQEPTQEPTHTPTDPSTSPTTPPPHTPTDTPTTSPTNTTSNTAGGPLPSQSTSTTTASSTTA
ncbi:ATP-binding protein [Streptomyces sp. NBRC 110028]|uniref:ATP-binding protein n=1 Tax=Streptomyces sp. NBRC 110028 TaxID=1621260 RepID=UPI0006E1B546|nr:ATP-binding protein [Streptomyces sp. NBRC 110028]